jgi:hypothetical protein
METRTTCPTCGTNTERRELPSGSDPGAVAVTKVVSYWCGTCHEWQATTETPSDVR